MKRMVGSINYHDIAFASNEDAINLLAILGRAVRVKRDKYNTPYFPADDQTPLIERVSFEEVSENQLAAAAVEPAPEEEIVF